MITTLVRRVVCQQLRAQPNRTCVRSAPAQAGNLDRQYDELQEMALKEQCILVDENDHATGFASKADCHRVDPQSKEVKLHRAFSVFLFNTKGEMLVQKRSDHKVSYL